MAQQYRFRDDELCNPHNNCLLPPPEFDCEDVCEPCNPCETKCPPKVRVHEAVCLADDEYERCFSLYQKRGCEPAQIPAFINYIGLRVRRRGFCRVLTEECPIRTDLRGNACFVWSDDFRALPAGYYEADLYINDKHCYTWLFRKEKCWALMKTESVEHEELPCEAPCRACVGCVPTPDIEQTPLQGDCEKCDGNQCE